MELVLRAAQAPVHRAAVTEARHEWGVRMTPSRTPLQLSRT
jgi:hypothetical protein